jgi:hypothetical protein
MKKTDKKPQPGWSPKSARQDLSRAESNPTNDRSLDYARESLVREITRTGGLIGSQN